MGIEIEKKYRLAPGQSARLKESLGLSGATLEGEEFEENTLYAGGTLDPGRQVLRVRRVGQRAILTYKERFFSTEAIKHNREDETVVENADALSEILNALGFRPALVYEKRRATWRLANTEIVLDELPFGLFAEIEGEEQAIREVEERLCLKDAEPEMATYPELTRRHGVKRGDLIEARFV
jgi:predicted adenylyl cyclase CyaB